MNDTSNDIIIIIVSATIVLLILLIFIISFLFIYKDRQMRNDAKMKSLEEKYNQETLKAQLEIQEQTMKNISEEIHDDVGQVLSLVVVNLSAIELGDPDSAALKIEGTTGLVKKAITDLRNLSKSLDTENIDKVGLSAFIRHELDLLDKTGKYKTFFRCEGSELRLDASREIVAYRIVQEGLNNVIRHAAATEVGIGMQFTPDHLSIEVSDNGKGFEYPGPGAAACRSNGAGLNNMRNRARLMDANIEITSHPSSGTRIRLTIPINARPMQMSKTV